jgi:hypothetical protein
MKKFGKPATCLVIGPVAFEFPTTRRELAQVSLHCAEEVLQFLEGFLGTFFLQEMAAIETAPGNR